MKLTAVYCLALCSLVFATAQDIVLLGDSLSDNGNGYAANAKFVLQTNDTYPQLPYYEGRWQNGPTWIEVAAQQLGVNLQDFAAAGATTGTAPAQVPPLNPPFGRLTVPTTVLSPTLFQQLNSLFLLRNNTLNSRAIYFIFIGGNDALSTVLQNTTVTADQISANYRTAIQQLVTRGARRFVLVGAPALSGLPVFTQPSVYGFYSNASIARLDALVAELGTQLQSIVADLPTQYPGVSADYFFFGEALGQLVQNAAAYGLTNLQQACYVIAPDLASNSMPTAQPIGATGGQLCSSPDSYLFFDQFHPSRLAHEFIGEYFVQQYGQRLFSQGNSVSLAPSANAPGRLPVLTVYGK